MVLSMERCSHCYSCHHRWSYITWSYPHWATLDYCIHIIIWQRNGSHVHLGVTEYGNQTRQSFAQNDPALFMHMWLTTPVTQTAFSLTYLSTTEFINIQKETKLSLSTQILLKILVRELSERKCIEPRCSNSSHDFRYATFSFTEIKYRPLCSVS